MIAIVLVAMVGSNVVQFFSLLSACVNFLQDTSVRLQRPASAKGSRRRRQGITWLIWCIYWISLAFGKTPVTCPSSDCSCWYFPVISDKKWLCPMEHLPSLWSVYTDTLICDIVHNIHIVMFICSYILCTVVPGTFQLFPGVIKFISFIYFVWVCALFSLSFKKKIFVQLWLCASFRGDAISSVFAFTYKCLLTYMCTYKMHACTSKYMNVYFKLV